MKATASVDRMTHAFAVLIEERQGRSTDRRCCAHRAGCQGCYRSGPAVDWHGRGPRTRHHADEHCHSHRKRAGNGSRNAPEHDCHRSVPVDPVSLPHSHGDVERQCPYRQRRGQRVRFNKGEDWYGHEVGAETNKSLNCSPKCHSRQHGDVLDRREMDHGAATSRTTLRWCVINCRPCAPHLSSTQGCTVASRQPTLPRRGSGFSPPFL